MAGVLEGVRVVDFGQYIAGPLAATLLSDQGADVVHVDPPGGPRWKSDADAFLNRGKRHITLDLKDAADRAIAQQLVERSDVVIENFRPGVMDRLGLDLSAPRLIACSLPGFAADDPRSEVRAWEGIIAAATGNCRARAGEAPPVWDTSRATYSAIPLASNFAAFLAATSIVMALIARQRSGRGQRIDVPLFDAMFTAIGPAGAHVVAKGLHEPRPIDVNGSGTYRCGDGRYVQFDPSVHRFLTWFAQAAGITAWGPDLLDVERLKDPARNEQLHSRRRELGTDPSDEAALECEFARGRAEDCVAQLRGAGVSAQRVVQLADLMQDASVRARGLSVTHCSEEVGDVTYPGLSVCLSNTPMRLGAAARTPGADAASVLGEVGLEQAIPRLEQKWALQTSNLPSAW